MTSAPIVLVPGFWLGAWAWDDVVSCAPCRHATTTLTLPGLESAGADRSKITLSNHVDAICDAKGGGRAGGARGTHGAGALGYAASDRVPEHIAAMVYVDLTRDRRAPAGLRQRRETAGLGRARGGGEPRRAREEQPRDLRQRPCRSREARCAMHRADQRCSTGRADDGYLHGIHSPSSTRTLSKRATRGSAVSASCETSPGRSPDEPLADVVTTEGARRHHRRRRARRVRGLRRSGLDAHGAVRGFAGGLVGGDHDAGAGRPAVRQPQRTRRDAFGKELFAGAEHYRERQHVVRVDQVVLDQRLDQVPASVYLQPLARLFLPIATSSARPGSRSSCASPRSPGIATPRTSARR